MPTTPFEETIDDSEIDFSQVPRWFPSRYGPGDQRGTLNEITPEKIAQALKLPGPKPHVYNLGLVKKHGSRFPGMPDRLYYQLSTGSSADVPAPLLWSHDERVFTCLHWGTHLDMLNHVGIGDYLYNGLRDSEIRRPWGTVRLGAEAAGPIVTRGILLDITRAKGTEELPNGYRITIGDIEAALRLAQIEEILPGDAVIIHTGRIHRWPSDSFFLDEQGQAGNVGVWLAEARWLAQFRPALIGTDCYTLEPIPSPPGRPFQVHQLLIVRYGIRIAEMLNTAELAKDTAYEFLAPYVDA
ncbi:MAG: cyclase family protein [Chloroflexi bacterium]|nr:cyclase family protein [Chloroflexota bacterium]